jgi:hypothetical protein
MQQCFLQQMLFHLLHVSAILLQVLHQVAICAAALLLAQAN